MQRLSYIPSSQKVLYDFEECEIEHDLRQVVDSHDSPFSHSKFSIGDLSRDEFLTKNSPVPGQVSIFRG